MPVASEDAQERPAELLVGERVAERVDGTVQVAQPVGDVVDDVRNAAEGQLRVGRTEADEHREDVPRGPADDERAEYDRYRSQRLARAVLLFAGRDGAARHLGSLYTRKRDAHCV